MIIGLRIFIPIILLVFVLCVDANAEPNAPQLNGRVQFLDDDGSRVVSKEGTIDLVWGWHEATADRDNWVFELEQATDATFSEPVLRYQGVDYSTFISGLPAGKYFFRVRAISPQGAATDWSEAIKVVEIQYAGKTLVYVLMGVGACVFLATGLTIVAGHLHAEQPRGEDGSVG